MTDPTGTANLRRSFMAEGNRRLAQLRSQTHGMLVSHDLMKAKNDPLAQYLPHPGERLSMFASWFEGTSNRLLVSENWWDRFLQRAYESGAAAGNELLGIPPSGFVTVPAVYRELASREFAGIAAMMTQQVTRQAGMASLGQMKPGPLYRTVLGVLRKQATARVKAAVNTMTVQLHNAGRLQQFSAAGVTMVGVDPERLEPAKPSRFLKHDHAMHDGCTHDSNPYHKGPGPGGGQFTSGPGGGGGSSGKTVRVYHGSLGGNYTPSAGSHFGTLQAAKKRIRDLLDLPPDSRPEMSPRGDLKISVHAVELNLGKVAHLTDPGDWWPGDVASRLLEAGVITPDEIQQLEEKEFDFDPEELLRGKGYDTIAYENQHEHKGSISYVPLREHLVRHIRKRWPLRKRDSNPYHKGPGEGGGQFTSGPETGGGDTTRKSFGDPMHQHIDPDPQYAYHATNAENAMDIEESGKLRPHGPSYGTDQSTWPDLSREKRSYWTGDPQTARFFYPEGSAPALLRVKKSEAPLRRENTGDLYSSKPIEAEKIEYWSGAGWEALRRKHRDHLVRDDAQEDAIAEAQDRVDEAQAALAEAELNEARLKARVEVAQARTETEENEVTLSENELEIAEANRDVVVGSDPDDRNYAARVAQAELSVERAEAKVDRANDKANAAYAALYAAEDAVEQATTTTEEARQELVEAEAALEEAKKGLAELVNVLTAGDDKVCQVCQDLSTDGPYSLEEARTMLPAHPHCRCAFIPYPEKDDTFE